MHLRERRHLHRIVDDEGRLNEGTLAILAEDLVDELTLAGSLVHGLNLEFVQGDVANFLLAQSVEVVACLLLDGVEDRYTLEGSLVADGLALVFHLVCSIDGNADGLEQFLGELHHPVVVLIGHI